jgi:hypothetical protein
MEMDLTDADGTSQREGAFAVKGDATSRGVGGAISLHTYLSPTSS